MGRQLYPAEAEQDARAALARAGITVFNVQTIQHGIYIRTTVSVNARDADRALAALRRLAYEAGSGVDRRGETSEVWVERRVAY
jgi:histidinol-phosphate/aromatic aminotransferase/cobyric acid decarboxylase-like protein